MQEPTSLIRSTPTPKPGEEPRIARRSADPTRLFIQRDRLPWIWFGLSVAVILLASWDRQQLVSAFQHRERVIIVDPAGTYYLTPLLSFDEAKELHVRQATLATLAFLERNPRDFDHGDLLRQLFLKAALVKAQDQRAHESAEFRAKQLHQKAEIGKLDILATRENETFVNVTGQIIRTGVFQEKTFTEALPFVLRLRLLRNPNMATNGRLPTAVADFKYETPQ